MFKNADLQRKNMTRCPGAIEWKAYLRFSMIEIEAFLFMVGMVLAFGSIAMFIVMNVAVGPSSCTTLIHHQRLFVDAGSRALTIPGVCMLLTAAILSSGFSGRHWFANGWSLAQLGLAVLIFLNTIVFIRPLVVEVSKLAEQSAARGKLLESYARRKKLEDRFGAANLLMLVTTLLLAVFRS